MKTESETSSTHSTWQDYGYCLVPLSPASVVCVLNGHALYLILLSYPSPPSHAFLGCCQPSSELLLNGIHGVPSGRETHVPHARCLASTTIIQ